MFRTGYCTAALQTGILNAKSTIRVDRIKMIYTVSTHATAIEAHIVRGRLVCEGIPAFVTFEHHIWAKWLLSVALGGVRVQVPFSSLKEAAQVIENINNNRYKMELEEELKSADAIRCPKCANDSTFPLDWPWKIALVAILLFSVPLPYTHQGMKCGRCSHAWLASEQREYPYSVLFVVFVFLLTCMFIGYAMWCHWCKLNCERPICL